MPLHWRPAGPLPAAVYWRRRAVVAVAAALALVLLGWLLGRGDGEDRLDAAPTSPTASPSTSPSAGASPTATPSAPEPCGADSLEVQAAAGAREVRAGSDLRLTLTVRNTGDVPCRQAVGQAAVELLVTSGDDRIWSSDDCEPGGEPGEQVLAPGEAVLRAARWPGTRSAAGCPRDLPAAQPGTYRVTGRVGDLRVPGQVFTVVR